METVRIEMRLDPLEIALGDAEGVAAIMGRADGDVGHAIEDTVKGIHVLLSQAVENGAAGFGIILTAYDKDEVARPEE